jgi:tRNA threonylcarbamoyladenosine biosynthesis protein TsaB
VYRAGANLRDVMDNPGPEPPILYLDAAAPRVVAGLQAKGGPGAAIVWVSTRDEAGVGLFQLVDELLAAAGIGIGDLRTIVFCEGPGSLLGIRIVAMAIRTWQAMPRETPLRVFGYRSLELIAARLLESGTSPPFSVISDARRSTWNLLRMTGDGAQGGIVRAAADALSAEPGPVFHSPDFPAWQPIPEGANRVDYRPEDLPELQSAHALLREVAQPDAFLTEVPTYREWSPAGG